MTGDSVHFYSDGLKLAGTFTPAAGAARGEKRPAVICVHGYTGRKEIYMPAYVRELTGAGFHCLEFYHRGFGDSEGIRLRNKPVEQVADIESALVYMRQRSDVDRTRIALYGTSFGGSTVIAAAAVDKGVAAVISVGSPADCGRSFRSKRSYGDNLDFEDVLKEDRIRRVMTGESKRVPYGELVPSGRAERDAIQTMYKVADKYPDGYPLENFDHAVRFVPEDVVHKIAPRPVLFIHAERDTMVPLAEAQSFYAKAGEPKEIVILPGATHVDVYEPRNPETFKVVVGQMIKFLKKWLA
jgi:pimeloyl-ACP methyl ester carboxylesterase